MCAATSPGARPVPGGWAGAGARAGQARGQSARPAPLPDRSPQVTSWSYVELETNLREDFSITAPTRT